MLDPVLMFMACDGVLAATSGWTTAYTICLIVGGGLVAISTIFGGDADVDLDVDMDMDFDIDLDADIDLDTGDVGGGLHDAASGGLSLSSWFSMNFVVYFVAVFGLVGAMLTWMSDTIPSTVSIVAVVSGLIAGQGVHQLLRFLKRTSGNSTVKVSDFLKQTARVTVRIMPPAKGEIAIPVRGNTRFVPAVAKRSDDKFETRDEVVVVAFRNGTAEVISQKEFDFKTQGKS